MKLADAETIKAEYYFGIADFKPQMQLLICVNLGANNLYS